MRIDAHQHFWRYDPVEHNWMNEEMEVLKHDYLPGDLLPLLDEGEIDGTVAVQARQILAENDFLLALAKESPRIKGVVGWVDLRSPDLIDQLDRYVGHSKFVGVRHVVHDEPDDDFMLRPDFMQGIKTVGGYDLTYDLLLFPKHVARAIKLVQHFPDQPFVLDHIAKPFIRDDVLEPWETEIRELARHENVCCKVSGMVTEARWKQWQPEDYRPYLDVIFDSFGPQRLMWGSDWPVCTLSGRYAQVQGIVEDYIGQLPATTRAAVMGANAVKFYGLE